MAAAVNPAQPSSSVKYSSRLLSGGISIYYSEGMQIGEEPGKAISECFGKKRPDSQERRRIPGLVQDCRF